jgi:hypothetical protein
LGLKIIQWILHENDVHNRPWQLPELADHQAGTNEASCTVNYTSTETALTPAAKQDGFDPIKP